MELGEGTKKWNFIKKILNQQNKNIKIKDNKMIKNPEGVCLNRVNTNGYICINMIT